jgi:hypothetical protein
MGQLEGRAVAVHVQRGPLTHQRTNRLDLTEDDERKGMTMMNNIDNWKQDASNPIGPMQRNKANRALSDLFREHEMQIQLSDDGSSHSVWNAWIGPRGGGCKRPEVDAECQRIFDRFGGAVSRKTVGAIIGDIEAATERLKGSRPIVDARGQTVTA